MNMIQLAELSDLNEIKSLTESCAKKMICEGIFQWNEHYPSLEKLKADILKEELYCYFQNKKIFGIIVITETVDKEYLPVKWLTENNRNIYIHRLATHPDVWGEGYAQKLMDFAEEKAKVENYASVRLDTFSKNPRNQNFYEQRGYKRLEEIFFPKQSEHPFYCYELLF